MISKLSPLLLTLVVAVGCAKKEEFDEVFKTAETSTKASFFTPYSESNVGASAFANEQGSPIKEGMSKKYLYVPMTMGTPRQVRQANPFYQGDTKLVRMKFTKAGLEIFELEKDDRFAENELNNTPVLTIPGDHLAYRCKENSFGDCTNAEEENSELTWDKKNYFKADYDKLEVKELNFLDLANVEGDSCVTPNGVRLVDYEVVKDEVINIQLEKTYKLKNTWRCIRENYFTDNLQFNSFKVQFFYSMVALDKLASKDYQKLEYPLRDHDVYGFFKSQSNKLNDEFDSQRIDKTYLANRWNPKKDILTYYLSASFSKPSNKPILDATMKSMRIMNKNLAAAGAKFKLQFLTQTKQNEKSPGDLRYNSIVLIDDPLANGLLGYAPSVKNPETGEIIQSHINMYGGVLTSGTKWVYENAVDLMTSQKLKESKIDTSIKVAESVVSADVLPSSLIAANVQASALSSTSEALVSTVIKPSNVAINFDHNVGRISQRKVKQLQAKLASQMRTKVDFKARFDQMMSGDIKARNELERRSLMKEADELGYWLDPEHAPEFFPIAGTTKAVYPDLLKIPGILHESGSRKGILKRWKYLNRLQRDKVKEVILVNRYISTFIHEVGHSLGLRHNFAGSTDAENFYSDKETQEILGDNQAKAPAYSSVMDYSFSDYNHLVSFGSYDVAALKFAYAGLMQTSNGAGVKPEPGKSLVDFRKEHNDKVSEDFLGTVRQLFGMGEEDELTEERAREMIADVMANPAYASAVPMLREVLNAADSKIVTFAYCTDQNAGLSRTCNRFDEGTTLLEIVNHKIEKYKNWYKYRNFRDGRDSFNSYGLPGYLIGRYREFYQIRDAMEDYELFSQFFPKEVMENGCSESQVQQFPICKQINDRREAMLKAADFFIEVLKTPDHLCAVAAKDEPNKIIEYKKLIDIYDDIKFSIDKHLITSCFEEEVVKHLAENKTENAEGTEVAAPLVVVGENGKYLNEFKDTNPDYKYASDRAVRGVWVDKVMAMRMLYERSSQRTTDTTHMALVDHPIVKAKVEKLIKHLALGAPLQNPIPFTKENGDKFIAPYVIGNDYKVDQVEDYFQWVKYFVGLPQNGKGNLTEALLSQVTNFNLSFDDDMEDIVYNTNNYVTVRKHRRYEPLNVAGDDLKSINVGRFAYVAGPENVIAYYIAKAPENMAKLDPIGKETIKSVIERRTVLAVPADLTKGQKAFWDLEEGFQTFLINKAKEEYAARIAHENANTEEEGEVPTGDVVADDVTEETEATEETETSETDSTETSETEVAEQEPAPYKPTLPVDAFNATFGEENGPALYEMYLASIQDNGAEMEQIVATKKANTLAMTTPAEDDTDEVKMLFKEDLGLLNDYVSGLLSKEAYEFYKKQLVRLPQHRDTLNM